MGKHKTTNFSQRLSQFVKKTDTFGTPVSLTYKSDPQIKSVLGGFFTMMARIGVAIFFFISCVDILNKQNTLQTSILKRDLTTDTTETKLTLDNFDLGVRLEYTFFEEQPEIQEQLDQYVYLQVSQNTYTWNTDKSGASIQQRVRVKTDLGNCSNGRLGLAEDKSDFLSLRTGYLCPEKVEFSMKGSYSGEESKFIQVRATYCNQTYLNEKYNSSRLCKSLEEQNTISAYLKLYFVIQNSYFDSDDFSGQPIKTFLKPYFLTSKNYTAQLFYMALSENTATYNDNILYGKATQTQFIETRVDYQVSQEIHTISNFSNSFIAVNIMMDDGYKVVDRKVKTFIDVLQSTGGFMTVIFVIILIIISRLQKTIYNTSLIKSLYKYQRTTSQPGDDSMFSNEEENKKNIKSAKVEQTVSMFNPNDKIFEKKQMMLDRILDQISKRKKLIYGLTPIITNLFKKLFCKRLTKRQSFNEALFKRGQLKIQKELDIRHIAKQLKTLKFIAQIMLNKQQRFMIEYFKENLLNNKNEKDIKISKSNHARLLKKHLQKTINCTTNEKIDARMLKNIDYEDNEVLEQLIKELPKSQSENTTVCDRTFTSAIKDLPRGRQRSQNLSPYLTKTDFNNTNNDDILVGLSQKSIPFIEDYEEIKLDKSISNCNTDRNLKNISSSNLDKQEDKSTQKKAKISHIIQGKANKNKSPRKFCNF